MPRRVLSAELVAAWNDVCGEVASVLNTSSSLESPIVSVVKKTEIVGFFYSATVAS